MFRKHISQSLINIYHLICSCLSILIYFTFFAVFGKKSVPKTLFQHIFAFSDALFDPIWHKLFDNNKMWSLWMRKKTKQHMLLFGNVSKRKFPKIGRNQQNLKKLHHFSKFQDPKRGKIIPKLINLASLNVSFFITLDEIIKVFAF